ncbi:MAG: S8 family serine peptidase [Promethearchaeota archaeon]
MKKRTYILIGILLFSMIPAFIPVVFASKTSIGNNTGFLKAEMQSPYCGVGTNFGSGRGKVPFSVDMVDADKVWSKGTGVYIAVLDTGLLSNWRDILPQGNIKWKLGKGFTHEVGWDPIAEDYTFGPLIERGFEVDDWKGDGHGTHVTSTITGYLYDGSAGKFWVRGVAPNVKIIPVLVLDNWYVPDAPEDYQFLSGGTDPMVAAGINYIADIAHYLHGPVIISMSLGGPEPAPIIKDAIDYAISEGVIVIASAGNSGEDGMGWPGAYPEVISVGAAGWTEQWVPVVDHDYSSSTGEAIGWSNREFWLNDVPENLHNTDVWGNEWQVYLEDFSSRPIFDHPLGEQELDVCTPGACIVGPYKPEFADFEDYFGYYYVWGTSQACPHVSGIAALILQRFPYLNQWQMETILKAAASTLPMDFDSYPGEEDYNLAYVYDPIYDYLSSYYWGFSYYPWEFVWEDDDFGAGFLRADRAMMFAYLYWHYWHWHHHHHGPHCRC